MGRKKRDDWETDEWGLAVSGRKEVHGMTGGAGVSAAEGESARGASWASAQQSGWVSRAREERKRGRDWQVGHGHFGKGRKRKGREREGFPEE